MRSVNLNKFITYVETNYRTNLNSMDYEILKEIAKEYPAQEIKLALDYCKGKKTNSLIYLQDALNKKYYQNEQVGIVPSWIDEELKAEPLDEEDKEWCRKFYKKYCDNEEEYHKRLKDNGLEEY